MKILVLGIGPLPKENPPILHGSCHRTWQFTRPLVEDGHEVTLVAFRIPDPRLGRESVEERHKGGFRSLLVDEATRFRDDDYMRSLIGSVGPDAVVGVNVYPACRACELGLDVPIWADINGYIMAEAQAKASLDDDDGYIHHFWSQMEPALRRADVFSACSGPQRHALIGELGALGRLSAKNLGYDLVWSIPNAREEEDYSHVRRVIRGNVCPEDAFIVLSSGLLTVWWDVETSFRALDGAMRRNPRIHFVCLGGKVRHHDERSFPRFESLVTHAAHPDRFHFVGWVPAAEVGNYLLEADVGYSVDKKCYEAIFGARNRVTEMLKAGLPPVTTLGTEITRLVSDRRAGLVSSIGDTDGLTQQLLWAADHPDELAEMGRRGQGLFRECFTIEATTGALRAWAKAPKHAPDYGAWIRLGGRGCSHGSVPERASQRRGGIRGLASRVLGREDLRRGKKNE
jgi:glycosyltransferase involved in cell wall biosynthesis